jgi:endonuclease G
MFFGLAIVGFVYIYNAVSGEESNHNRGEDSSILGANIEPDSESDRDYIPAGSAGKLIHHDYYSLSYLEEYEVPEWVAYKLTAESLRAPNVPRNKRFTEDYAVKTKSARHKDYSHSGYTRGHMAPAGDMAFNKTAMKQTFFMSNMTPQISAFNGGIWRELEECVRDWAFDNDELYVVSGPIFTEKPRDYIGDNRVAVPQAFFKAILDNKGSEKKAIGYIMEHKKLTATIDKYAVSIDEIESVTGLDLFADVLSANEEQIESTFDSDKWELDKKRYKQRVNNWNNN